MGWLKRIWLWIRKKIGFLSRVKVMEQQKIVNGNCWVAYFDMLGFKRRVLSFQECYKDGAAEILAYDIEEIRNSIRNDLNSCSSCYHAEINYVNFSDTFVFFTSDDSIDSYCAIEALIKSFFLRETWNHYPFTGAITYGNLYADLQKNVFVGEALIRAYEYVQKQDWLGCVLTPQAQEKLSGTDFDPKQRPVYVQYDVPIKVEKISDGITTISNQTEYLCAYVIGAYGYVKESVEQMRNEAEIQSSQEKKESIMRKYDNTLKFIDDIRPRFSERKDRKTNQ